MFLSLFLLVALKPGPSPLEQLTVYAGSWTVDAPATSSAAAHADHLTNHCHMTDAFYTCEQVVNGKSVALLVFTATDTPGLFHSQVVLPDGHAAGRSDVTISGNHWTYLSKEGSPQFKVENTFTGRDRIHYEQFQAAPDGSWTKTGEGNEVRVPAP